mgnify:CR=1 FL=1
MTNLIAKNNISVLIGMGLSGRSAARYLQSIDQPFVWLGNQGAQPDLSEIERELPRVHLALGDLDRETL